MSHNEALELVTLSFSHDWFVGLGMAMWGELSL